MSERDPRTVRDIGEFGLIAALQAVLPASVVASERLTIGIGDDAAVWRPISGESLVVTTDTLVEHVHFRLDWTDWASLGHKSLAVNLSDLAAMGAAPALALVTLGLRGSERVADLEAMYHGLGELAARHGVAIAGGDIVASPDALTIHVTAIGQTRTGRVLTRSGARPGDSIAVSGTLGASAAGMRLLADANSTAAQAATADALIASHLRPEPRIALGSLLLAEGASAAMDLSDGLAGDLPKILAASKVSGQIETAQIPASAAVRALFAGDWLSLALRGGEDYELLFTADREAFAAITAAAPEIGSTITEIGTIGERQGDAPRLHVRHADGSVDELVGGAFDHFGQ